MAKRGQAARKPSTTRKRTAARRRTITAIDLKKENANLRRELTLSRRQQTATADVLKVISRSAFDLQTVLETLVESAARLCEADSAFVYQRDAGVFRLAATYGFSPEYEDFMKPQIVKPSRGTLAGRTALEASIVHIPDILADPEYTWQESQARGGYRTMLGAPMLREGFPIGVFAMTRASVKPFTNKQIALLQTFTDQAVIAIENIRLLKELHQRTDDLTESLQQQTATADVLKVISRSTFDLQTVLDTLVASATQLCEAYDSIIFLREGDHLHVSAHHGPLKLDFDRWPLGRGWITGRALADRTPVHVYDPVAFAAEFPDGSEMAMRLDYRTILAVPLLKENEAIGVLTIRRSEMRPFTDKQIELVSTFADQAVIAIANVRLFDEVQARTEDLRESLQQQTATADVLKVISRSAFDLQAVFETVVESSARLCGADRAFIFRFDGELLRLAAAFNSSSEFTEWIAQHPIHPGRHSGAARAALERRTIHIPDVLADPDYSYGAKDVESIRTILGVPILKGDELLGVMMIYHLEVRPFTDKQIALVETFADQAAIAIENVRLFDEVQARTEDLRESLRQQTATAEVLKVISRSAFDLGAVLRTLVESAARLCEADKGTITRQKDGVFYRAESFGFSREFMDHVRDIPVARDRGSATGRALLEGVVVHIPDVQKDLDYHFDEAQRLGNYRTLLAVPMLREGTPIGVVTLTRPEARPFTEKQIELVTTFADQAAIAIENVRLFEQVRERTEELSLSLDNLRTAQDRLVQTEKLASLGQLTAGIAHEIKNPLNFVNNFAALSAELVDELDQVLKPAALDDKAREDTGELTQMLKGNLEKVVQHGKRADSIVKNMLLHSREGSGERRAVDLNAIVEDSLNLAYHGARAEKQEFNIRLERSFDPAAGVVDLFPQEITRVLLNLISNGVYAAMKRKAETRRDGYEPTLTAGTKNVGDNVEIRIRDNGGGIPPEVKEKIFNPFFTTKPPGEGTGLGLSLSHDIIVKQHLGSIEVDTQPGEFTEFRVILPRKPPSARPG